MSIANVPVRRARRSWAASALVAALALSGAAAAPVLANPQAAYAARVAHATTPGQPGTPQAPTPLFTEDFSHQDASAAAIPLQSYTGAPGTAYVAGTSGASSETYSADPAWSTTHNACNGWIASNLSPAPASDTGCVSDVWTLQVLAQALGLFQGMTPTAANANQGLAEFTSRMSTPGVEFQTNNPIPAVAGHFYQASAILAAADCGLARPDETFSLIVNGTVTPVGTGLDPCTDPSARTIDESQVASLRSSALQVTGTSPTLGLQLTNAQGQLLGNDVALDLPQILDVTPQLDKSFSPSTIRPGGASTLTYVITNTSELAAKDGWRFTDDLPAGMTAKGVNATTCSSGAVTAGPGAPSVSVSGNLNAGQASCSVTVQVTAGNAGTYTNGPGNFPAGTAGLDGLNPPGTSTLTVAAVPSPGVRVVKSTSTRRVTHAGQRISFLFRVTNVGNVTLRDVHVTDTTAAASDQGNLSRISCPRSTLAQGQSETCTATYTVTLADVNRGMPLGDSATATGIPPATAADPDPAPLAPSQASAVSVPVTRSPWPPIETGEGASAAPDGPDLALAGSGAAVAGLAAALLLLVGRARRRRGA